MKRFVKVLKEVEVKYLEIDVPVRFGEEDIPNDFPGRSDDRWKAMVDLDEHRILG